MSRRILLTLLVALSCAFPASSVATTAPIVEFGTMVSQSDTILLGTVSKVRNRAPAPPQVGDPRTDVVFSEIEVLKGTPTTKRSFTLHLTGGYFADGRRLEIVGAPQFSVGERAIVFLHDNGIDAIPIVGVWQGVARVHRDSGSNEEMVDDVTRSATRRSGESPLAAGPAQSTAPPIPLADLLSRIRSELARQGN